MTLGDLWRMEQAVMGAYEEVEHINDPTVQCRALGMVLRWRELQVDLLNSVAESQNVKIGDLAVMESSTLLVEADEILAKVAWANIEQGMVELHRLTPAVKDAQR